MKNLILTLICLFFLNSLLHAQNQKSDSKTKSDRMTEGARPKSPSADSDNNAIVDFVKIEKQPQFPGGMQAFYQYLGQHIKYPKEAAKNKIQGKVFLTFIVERDGALTHVEVTRGVSPEIDAEALRVISSSPKWNPGMQDGLPVRVKYNINVNFNLR